MAINVCSSNKHGFKKERNIIGDQTLNFDSSIILFKKGEISHFSRCQEVFECEKFELA